MKLDITSCRVVYQLGMTPFGLLESYSDGRGRLTLPINSAVELLVPIKLFRKGADGEKELIQMGGAFSPL